MKIKNQIIPKTLVIIIVMIFISISFISNYQYARAQSSTLSNDDLRPKIGNYWVYELIEIGDGAGDEYNFKINYTITSEIKTKVAGKEVKVFIVEGIGEVTKWSTKDKVADKAEMKIVKRIRKDNLEMIRYSRFFDLEYHEAGNITTTYDYTNTTYNYTKFDKPTDISLGATWDKEISITEENKKKPYKLDPEENVFEFISNSTLFFDNILEITVPAGTFNVFQITEWQYTREYDNESESWVLTKNTVVDYYYAKDVNGYVKRVVKNIAGDIIESEELLEYGEIKTGDGKDGSDGEDDKDALGWLDVHDRNVQIALGVTFIILACIIIGLIASRRRKFEMEKEMETEAKGAKKGTNKKGRGKGNKRN